jgi:hypothetical protein
MKFHCERCVPLAQWRNEFFRSTGGSFNGLVMANRTALAAVAAFSVFLQVYLVLSWGSMIVPICHVGV